MNRFRMTERKVTAHENYTLVGKIVSHDSSGEKF